MTLEQNISNLVQAADNLTDVVDNKIQEIDQRVTSKIAEMDAYIGNARTEYGHICTTPNQVMLPNTEGNGVAGLNHIYMTLDVSLAAAFLSGSGESNGWPNDIAREFGTSINCLYTNAPFNIVRVKWSCDPSKPTRFNDTWKDGKHQGTFTEAAYIKVLSGQIGGEFELQKSFDQGWGLYGRFSDDPFLGGHSGLMLESAQGEMLIAMYGRVTGRVDLEHGRWGIFPKLGG